MKIDPKRAMYMAVCALTGACRDNIQAMCSDDKEAERDVTMALHALGARLYDQMIECKFGDDSEQDDDDHDDQTMEERIKTIELFMGSTNSLMSSVQGYIEHMHYMMEQKWGTKPDEQT